MKKTIEQLIRANFYENGVALQGRDFNQAYHDLMYDYLAGDVQIIESDGTVNKAFPEKKDKIPANFTKYREQFDDLMYDYAKEHPESEFSTPIKDIAYGKNRHLVHFDIDEKIELQPNCYSAYDKTVVKMRKAMRAQDVLDMPKNEVIDLIKDAAKAIKGLKPSIFTWLFNRNSYNTRMKDYTHLKENFLSGLKNKYYPEFLHTTFGTPAKVCGLNIDTAPSYADSLVTIKNEYQDVVDKSHDKEYTYAHRPEIIDNNDLNKVVENIDVASDLNKKIELAPEKDETANILEEDTKEKVVEKEEVIEEPKGMTEKDIDPLLKK